MALEERFMRVARSAGAQARSSTLAAVAAELVARWAEPHRRYHGLRHLTAVLDEVEADPVVALAAWGHDAVYDPRSPHNELRSALLLCGLLSRCRLPRDVIAEASRLVLLTAGHRAAAGDRRGHLLADADLAILAAPGPAYESYVEAVRAEYAHVPEALWRSGRAAVLRHLLDLPVLFQLYPERETSARINLTRELAALS